MSQAFLNFRACDFLESDQHGTHKQGEPTCTVGAGRVLSVQILW